MSIHLQVLVSKLNDTCRRAAARAASITMARGHYEVDIEHVMLALLEDSASDVSVLCARHDVDAAALQADLEHELSRLTAGNSRRPVFSARVPEMLQQAWLIASLEAHEPRIRSAHLLLALLTQPALSQIACRSSRHFARFPIEQLKHKLAETTEGSAEAAASGWAAPCSGEDASSGSPASPGALLRTPALDQFTTDLTQRAREGRIDPVIGRDAEIRHAIDILMRRRQNNPILTGEAGVGKTAVVEGLALRIAAGDVPQPLQAVALHALDIGLLQAGASVKGEFENRLKSVIEEVKRSPHPIVLFIDEAHTMIGAGGPAGQQDAANLLKPALARGELRTIAATTWSEYKKYFEKDAALARRFQVVKVEEPDEELAVAMLRGMAPLMEAHFKVCIRDQAIKEAVRLSARYISGRQLPDKAISVLDTACAQVALGQSARPPAIEQLLRLLERLATEESTLQREAAAGTAHGPRLQALEAERRKARAQLDALCTRYEAERAMVEELQSMRRRLESEAVGTSTAGPLCGSDHSAASTLQARLAALAALQAGRALVPLEVDAGVVAGIVSAWTGIPLGRMAEDELRTVLQLESLLEERVLGQRHAVAAIAQRVRMGCAQLEDPGKPRGVFLFVGPSGVGKTETARALAELLYGGERKLITINMSEYQEAHSVSGLKGSPPGYVGYGEGGVLTEAVRRNPYSVLLLDEAEKAHSDVLELFYQVFDRGELDDAEGRAVDFRHCVIILTSNVGSAQVMQACLNRQACEYPEPDALAQALRPVLSTTFKPAFLGRVMVVPFYAIDDDTLDGIIRLKLDRIAARVTQQHQACFTYDDDLVDAVLARCTEVDSGARNIDHILNGTLLPMLAGHVLERMADGLPVLAIHVSAHANGSFAYRFE